MAADPRLDGLARGLARHRAREWSSRFRTLQEDAVSLLDLDDLFALIEVLAAGPIEGADPRGQAQLLEVARAALPSLPVLEVLREG